jgi:hypothetical protein
MVILAGKKPIDDAANARPSWMLVKVSPHQGELL